MEDAVMTYKLTIISESIEELARIADMVSGNYKEISIVETSDREPSEAAQTTTQ